MSVNYPKHQIWCWCEHCASRQPPVAAWTPENERDYRLELDLQAIPLDSFLEALAALTPHDLTVIAKPVAESEPVLDHDRAAISVPATILGSVEGHDRAVMAKHSDPGLLFASNLRLALELELGTGTATG